ncbi:D-3-phosphoglycerate dehydrogenase [Thalassoglobus neptunius]|uniref:D-3-phosphoglycerate dehydrogenase n=1 Tax=Thalassoglobus neptunius TaxID=1938619 RepID=A0A5C5X118_9PLAN|nr:phosphoglycerate dehydrogenase [Thalassoglobus neptunius]TWT56687.1 D-3-phosphoglycerate dehydrogenase [Thalassoglobus neptunius]
MYRVLVSDNLSPIGLKLLEDHPEIDLVYEPEIHKDPSALKEALATTDGIVIRSGTKLTEDVLSGQKRLKVVARAGVGVDNVDLVAATRQGIVVSNTPDGNTLSTAEQTIAMMMGLCRNIGPASQSMREGRWDRKLFTGTQLAGKTVGVIGLGRIGLAVARRCNGLEMNVLGYDPFLSEERAAEQNIELYRDIDELLVKCDLVTVHTPLTDETRGLINAERLKKMKEGVRLVNCARGGIIDEEALLEGLESGQVGGAALDVYVTEKAGANDKLASYPNVLCTPHLGASTEEAQEQVAVEAAEIVCNFLTRNEIRSAVNMVPISGKELEAAKAYLDLAYRLGLMLAQLAGSEGIKGAELQYRGDVTSQPVKLITSAFTSGLLSAALDDTVSIVNSDVTAKDRGIAISQTSTSETGAFATMISATVRTDQREITAGGTTFGNDFLRLVKLNDYQLDAYLDGLMLIYRHKDVPGLIGAIGTTFGKHQVNISHMALGREKNEPGGEAVAVLNLDNAPSEEALKEVQGHPDVTGVQLVNLPPAKAPLPWLGL